MIIYPYSNPDYLTHHDKDINIRGLIEQGRCENRTSYEELVSLFGDKAETNQWTSTDAEWHIEFPDGFVAVIYNWQTGKAYLGPTEGLSVDLISGDQWHIDGNHPVVVERIHKIVRDYRREVEKAA